MTDKQPEGPSCPSDPPDNMALWNAVRQPPESALKQIKGGQLGAAGFTDINPQWRIQALTQQFGPCGQGWRWTIDRLWLEKHGDDVAAFAQITLEVWVWDPIPGIGGSMFVQKGRINDEAYKMAVTDAISVAAKCLGVGADIYLGRWDQSKGHYINTEPAPEDDLRDKWSRIKIDWAAARSLDGKPYDEKARQFRGWWQYIFQTDEEVPRQPTAEQIAKCRAQLEAEAK